MLCHKFLLLLALSLPIFSADGGSGASAPAAGDELSWMPSSTGWAVLAGAGSLGAILFNQKKALAPLFAEVDQALREYEQNWEPAVTKFNEAPSSVGAAAGGAGDGSAADRRAPARDLIAFTNYARATEMLTKSKVDALRKLAAQMDTLDARLKKNLKSTLYAISPIRLLISGKIVQLQQDRLGLSTIMPVLARLAACSGARACLQRAQVEFARHYDRPVDWVPGPGKNIVDVYNMLSGHITQVQEAIAYIQSERSALPRSDEDTIEQYNQLERDLSRDLDRAINAAQAIQKSHHYQFVIGQRRQ